MAVNYRNRFCFKIFGIYLIGLIYALVTPGSPVSSARAAQLSLGWDAVGESDIVGYRLFSRKETQAYDYSNPIWQGAGTVCQLDFVDDDEAQCFVARSYNSVGIESYDSNEVCYYPSASAVDTDGDGIADSQDPDNDNDGMTDEWEISHGLDPLVSLGADGADGDPDGDGWKNMQEFEADTDPNDRYSVPLNSPPTAPSPNFPTDKEVVTVQYPVFSINNAADPEGRLLSYEFEIYSDVDMTEMVCQTSRIAESFPVTQWQVPVLLTENGRFFWRSRAYDGFDSGPWSAPAQFLVNAVNEPPDSPKLIFPQDGATISGASPVLSGCCADDPDGDVLTYEFEVYQDNTLQNRYTETDDIHTDRSGVASWAMARGLEDSGTYWWRIRGVDPDGNVGKWSSLYSFYYQQGNAGPGVPVIASPADDQVDTVSPVLEINNSIDADGDALKYVFQIDQVVSFDSDAFQTSSFVSGGPGGTTSWQPSSLEEDHTYYWRVIAYDGYSYSRTFAVGCFFVNAVNDVAAQPIVVYSEESATDNNQLSAPLVYCPISGGIASATTPTLSVVDRNSAVDDVTYGFELYADRSLSVPIAKDQVTAGQKGGIVLWQVPNQLSSNAIYYWRARAEKEGDTSSWTPTSVLVIQNIDQGGADWLVRQPVYFDASEDQNIVVCDGGSALYGVAISIPQGALTEDATVGIRQSPLLQSDQTAAFSKIVEIIATGTELKEPALIRFPLGETIGENDFLSEKEIQAFRQDENGVWQPQDIDRIYIDQRFLDVKSREFGKYAVGHRSALNRPLNAGEASAEEGSALPSTGSSSGCFLQTIELN